MRFIKDKEVGYRLDTSNNLEGREIAKKELFDIIAEQYQDELKELGETAFIIEVKRTVEAIENKKHSAWVDVSFNEDDTIFHIEPDYGIGNIDMIISAVEI